MIAKDVELAEGVRIFQPDLVNLYGCRIGKSTKIGAFVEIQKGVRIGANCKISSHSFVCEGVEIDDDPGTGSIILQGVIAAVAGVAVTAKLYWSRIRSIFSRRRKPASEPDAEETTKGVGEDQ